MPEFDPISYATNLLRQTDFWTDEQTWQVVFWYANNARSIPEDLAQQLREKLERASASLQQIKAGKKGLDLFMAQAAILADAVTGKTPQPPTQNRRVLFKVEFPLSGLTAPDLAQTVQAAIDRMAASNIPVSPFVQAPGNMKRNLTRAEETIRSFALLLGLSRFEFLHLKPSLIATAAYKSIPIKISLSENKILELQFDRPVADWPFWPEEFSLHLFESFEAKNGRTDTATLEAVRQVRVTDSTGATQALFDVLVRTDTDRDLAPNNFHITAPIPLEAQNAYEVVREFGRLFELGEPRSQGLLGDDSWTATYSSGEVAFVLSPSGFDELKIRVCPPTSESALSRQNIFVGLFQAFARQQAKTGEAIIGRIREIHVVGPENQPLFDLQVIRHPHAGWELGMVPAREEPINFGPLSRGAAAWEEDSTSTDPNARRGNGSGSSDEGPNAFLQHSIGSVPELTLSDAPLQRNGGLVYLPISKQGAEFAAHGTAAVKSLKIASTPIRNFRRRNPNQLGNPNVRRNRNALRAHAAVLRRRQSAAASFARQTRLWGAMTNAYRPSMRINVLGLRR